MLVVLVGKAVIRIAVTAPGAGSLLTVVLVNALAFTVTCVVLPGLVPAFCVPLPAIGLSSIPKFTLFTLPDNVPTEIIPSTVPSEPVPVPNISPVFNHPDGSIIAGGTAPIVVAAVVMRTA